MGGLFGNDFGGDFGIGPYHPFGEDFGIGRHPVLQMDVLSPIGTGPGLPNFYGPPSLFGRPANLNANQPETVISAAVRLKNGQVFFGPTHSEAINAAIKANGGGVEFAPRGQGLFQTSTGRIINHRESLSLPAVREALGLPSGGGPMLGLEK